MKPMLKSIFLPALFFISSPLFSQELTGIWRGNFFSESGEQYKIEVQLENKGNKISGVTYSYLTTVFYGKATMTGNFNRSSEKVLFEEIKTVELRMSGMAVACIMKYNLIYTKSGKEEFLEGTYTSKYEKDSYGGKKGEDCGGGRVYLRRVVTSDFPMEPFLKKKAATPDTRKRTDSSIVKKPTVTGPQTNVAQKPKPPLPKTTTTTKTNTSPKPSSSVAQIKKPKTDSVKTIVPKSTDGENNTSKATQPKITLPKPTAISSRQNELVNTFMVHTEQVTVKLYDNGEIDGDTISVYLDNKLVLSQKRLTAAALELKLKMDEDNSTHDLVMVAENLGRIPPNTSLMIVEAGDDRYTARITSTYQKNAMVRFKYVKK
jgi:hypothetical protein